MGKGKDTTRIDGREGAMSDRDTSPETPRTEPTGTDARGAETERQAPRLSPEEIERLEDIEELEDFIEEPPDGPLSIISDQDVPGAPG